LVGWQTMAKKPRSVVEMVRSNQTRNISALSTDSKIFAEFLILIVDIKYRNRYGERVAKQNAYGYSDDVQSKTVLPDHVPPVDDGLVGH